MENIEELQLKKITIMIPCLRKKNAYKKNKIFDYLNARNSKRYKNQKIIKRKNLMNFKYIKKSSLDEDYNRDFSINSNWTYEVGKGKLKKFNNLNGTIQSGDNYNHGIMASTTIKENKNIKDIFGEKPFNQNIDNSKIVKLINSVIDVKDKIYKSLGQPQIFLEVNELPKHNKLILPKHTFHGLGSNMNNKTRIANEEVLSGYYDGQNSGFIYSMPKEDRYLAYDNFGMGQNYLNNTTIKRLFLQNLLHEGTFSKNKDGSEIDEITLLRLKNHVSKIEINSKDEYNKKYTHGFDMGEKEKIKGATMIKYNKIGDVGNVNSSTKERVEFMLEDQILEKKSEKKDNEIKNNKRIIRIAFATMAISLVALIVSICK